MAKVLLISSNIPKDEAASPPLGLAYLAGTLVKNGIDVKIVDGYLNRHNFHPSLKKMLIDFKPDIVGITMLTYGRSVSLMAASTVKTLKPDTMVVVGGPHPSLMYSDILEQTFSVDLIVIGEGENSMLEIAKGYALSEISGIAYRNNGNIKVTKPRTMTPNLDDIPFPAWHLMNLYEYPPVGYGIFNGISIDNIPRIGVAFSRGCLFNCSFCSARNIYSHYRHRSAENMVNELEVLNKKFNIKHFRFVDDLATYDKEAFGNMCDEIVKRDLRIAFNVTTRADCLSEELLNKMKKGGCYKVIIGVESGSDEILKHIQKNVTRKDNEFAIKLIKNSGIEAVALIMIGNKYETRQTINETINFLEDADPDEIGGGYGVSIEPGTAIYQMAKEEGLIDDDYWKSDREPPLYTGEYTSSQLRSFQRAIETRVEVPARGSFLVGDHVLDMFINLITKDNRLYRLKVILKLMSNSIYVRVKPLVHFLWCRKV